jgi:NAD(P)-dependent dehydrogenase (short-subunit alcohol dehydrogenase family)
MACTIVVTGASSGFGALVARALADAGNVVYAGMRGTQAKNKQAAEEAREYAILHKVDLCSIELDVIDDASIAAGIAKIIQETGKLDIIVYNAGHMAYGPAEAFTPEQFAQLYDINILST